MRPQFLFLPAGEKETRICALRAALRAVALRNAAAAAGARGWGWGSPFWEYNSFVGMHPPLLFLLAGEKEERRARWRRKRGLLVADLLEPRFYFAAQVVRTLCEVCPVVTLAVLLTALRAGAGRRRLRYGVHFFVVRRLFRCAGMHCGKLVLRYFSFRCCCAMRWTDADLQVCAPASGSGRRRLRVSSF